MFELPVTRQRLDVHAVDIGRVRVGSSSAAVSFGYRVGHVLGVVRVHGLISPYDVSGQFLDAWESCSNREHFDNKHRVCEGAVSQVMSMMGSLLSL